MYIHELNDWPRFHRRAEKLTELLASVRHRQGRPIGHMEALGLDLRRQAVLETLTADVLKSSEIEGEKLDAGQVRSSIALRLGMDIGALKPADRHVEGAAGGAHRCGNARLLEVVRSWFPNRCCPEGRHSPSLVRLPASLR